MAAAVAIIMAAYLIGAIPFGVLIGRLKGINVQNYGSGRTGTTNVLRTLGAWAALVVLVADVAKGALPVLGAHLILHSPGVEVGAGLAAMIGHNWSIYIGFRGGRGVATGLGGLFGITPLA